MPEVTKADIEEMVRDAVRDMLVRELLPQFLPKGSINPAKIQPIKLDGSEPANGATLKYDQVNGTVTF